MIDFRTGTPVAVGVSVSVVICSHTRDRRQSLAKAVDAELAMTYGDRLTVVPNAFRRGLSGAGNTGLQAASGAVIVFLDDDAVPHHPAALDAVRRALTENTVCAVGGAVAPAWRGGIEPGWFPPEFGWVVGCDYRRR